jgi:uncharacterized protein (DUF1697 family)
MEPELKAAIEARLLAHAGKRVGVLVRTAAEMAGVVADNPCPNAPESRVTASFLDARALQNMLDRVTGRNLGWVTGRVWRPRGCAFRRR